jgi:hypothetical protein
VVAQTRRRCSDKARVPTPASPRRRPIRDRFFFRIRNNTSRHHSSPRQQYLWPCQTKGFFSAELGAATDIEPNANTPATIMVFNEYFMCHLSPATDRPGQR